ncbi:HD domain-containing protein [Pseudooceanicola sp. MF1-13]|uniref:HD domain-containing protein n=1 Tax=Pseudooceanicola sp. MF1-13 TaxID=3379095 RepID=UPI003891D613
MTTTAILSPRDLALWQDARSFLDVRNNDEHTLVAYAVAKALLALTPEADESVVLPAVVLHDVGWKRIDPAHLLDAIDKKPGYDHLVRDHELHGVDIAREILERHRPDGVDIDAVLAIIDGHDTTKEARSINDAVMKDADKGWRATPHGMKTIRGWYGWDRAQFLDMLEVRSNPNMLTPAGRAIAEAFTASVRAELALDTYLET